MQLSDLQRLWQPRRIEFWLMLAFNAASTAIAFVVQTQGDQLSTLGRVVLAVFALGNCYYGIKLARTLMRA